MKLSYKNQTVMFKQVLIFSPNAISLSEVHHYIIRVFLMKRFRIFFYTTVFKLAYYPDISVFALLIIGTIRINIVF